MQIYSHLDFFEHCTIAGLHFERSLQINHVHIHERRFGLDGDIKPKRDGTTGGALESSLVVHRSEPAAR
jgi:hypothetical protein